MVRTASGVIKAQPKGKGKGKGKGADEGSPTPATTAAGYLMHSLRNVVVKDDGKGGKKKKKNAEAAAVDVVAPWIVHVPGGATSATAGAATGRPVKRRRAPRVRTRAWCGIAARVACPGRRHSLALYVCSPPAPCRLRLRQLVTRRCSP